jgi:hypothetical protein
MKRRKGRLSTNPGRVHRRQMMTEGEEGTRALVQQMENILKNLRPGENLRDYAERKDDVVRAIPLS